ncbi:MAG: sulfite exporter TauE/SafE family protein [Deltaproteobacteria bacterium]|nr:sulfite exporter TauE/SafE family protein [Deltaproteobacteria bacterium]
MLLNYPSLFYVAMAVLFAGFVRGFSGFGFSMIVMISLSFVLSPAEIVPMILLWEVAASTWLLPQVWRHVDWISIGWLLFGVLIGTPIGVFALTRIPPKPMQAIIAVAVILLVVAVWRGFRIGGNVSRVTTGGVGLISGILNGGATIGGPPVVLYYYSAKNDLQRARASLIAFFLATDLFAAVICATQGLMTIKGLKLTGMLLIPLVVGLTLGSRSFFKTDPEVFRRRVMALLIVLSIASFLQAVI